MQLFHGEISILYKEYINPSTLPENDSDLFLLSSTDSWSQTGDGRKRSTKTCFSKSATKIKVCSRIYVFIFQS